MDSSRKKADQWRITGILPWSCAVHRLCCGPAPYHRKAPHRSTTLCRWPPNLPVIQTDSFHESTWFSHCRWRLCVRTEELDDLQHVNGESQQEGILDCRKYTVRMRKHTVYSCGLGSDHTVMSVQNQGVIFLLQLENGYTNHKRLPKRPILSPHHRENPKIPESQETTYTIIHSFITSQNDYRNSLMNGLPMNIITKFQHVQNTAARLVFNLRKYDRIAVTLLWIPVK